MCVCVRTHTHTHTHEKETERERQTDRERERLCRCRWRHASPTFSWNDRDMPPPVPSRCRTRPRLPSPPPSSDSLPAPDAARRTGLCGRVRRCALQGPAAHHYQPVTPVSRKAAVRCLARPREWCQSMMFILRWRERVGVYRRRRRGSKGNSKQTRRTRWTLSATARHRRSKPSSQERQKFAR